MSDKKPSLETQESEKDQKSAAPPASADAPVDEKGGFRDAGLKEPTRYGDWDVKGRCSDF